MYADDLRPARFEWINNTRVVAQLNPLGTEVLYYTIDNEKVPMVGVGSLVTFQGLTQGVLQTAGRTIQSALDIEKAAAVASQTPMATGFLKNTGADMPEAQVAGLLAAWKQARQSRSTAYLTSTLSYETVGFSPKDMMTENDAILAEAVEELKNQMSTQVDEYLNYVVEQWVEDNQVAIEAGLRAELVDDFIGGLKNLFAEHYIEIPDEKVDVAQELANRVAELEESTVKSTEEAASTIASLTEQLKSHLVISIQLKH